MGGTRRVAIALALLAVSGRALRGQCAEYGFQPGPGPLPTGTVSVPYAVEFANGSFEEVYFYPDGNLPPGLTLAQTSYNTALLAGVPTTPGIYAFCVVAYCYVHPYWQTARQCYTLDVFPSCATPLTVSPSRLPDGKPTVPYSATLTASGGTPPYSFTLADGSWLPSGLRIGRTGVVSGTTTERGDFDFDLMVNDATCVSRIPSGIHVCIVEFLPTGALPDGGLWSPYAATLHGVVGVPPFTFKLDAGSLPRGLTLDPSGLISGTPDLEGTFPFRVTGTDATGCPMTYQMYLTIREVVADFTAAPRIAPPAATVTFTDLSSGAIASRTWNFGDGGTASTASPTHAYQNPGRYDVLLIVRGATETDAELRADYVLVTTGIPDGILTGQGPDPSAAPLVLGFDALATQTSTSIAPYAATGFGATTGAGNIDGAGYAEVLTGPGPAPELGPHVRAFRPPSTAIPKVNFYAFGTLNYGVRAFGAPLDADAPAEIVATPGPSPVFGPQVRGFNFDGVALTAMPGVNFYAYGTLRYGVNAAGGDIDGSGGAEIVTGPGPGPIFTPHVRAFRYGPPMAAIAKVSFVAFAQGWGARVACGDADGDGFDEILAAAGPGYSPPDVGLFNYDGRSVVPLAGGRFQPFYTSYGVDVAQGDLDGTAGDELLAAPGPDPVASAVVRGFSYIGGSVQPIPAIDFVAPYATRYGVRVSSGPFGF